MDNIIKFEDFDINENMKNSLVNALESAINVAKRLNDVSNVDMSFIKRYFSELEKLIDNLQ